MLLATVILLSIAAGRSPEWVRIAFERPFLIGKTGLTVDQFASFVRATGYRTAVGTENTPRNWKSPE